MFSLIKPFVTHYGCGESGEGRKQQVGMWLRNWGPPEPQGGGSYSPLFLLSSHVTQATLSTSCLKSRSGEGGMRKSKDAAVHQLGERKADSSSVSCCCTMPCLQTLALVSIKTIF